MRMLSVTMTLSTRIFKTVLVLLLVFFVVYSLRQYANHKAYADIIAKVGQAMSISVEQLDFRGGRLGRESIVMFTYQGTNDIGATFRPIVDKTGDLYRRLEEIAATHNTTICAPNEMSIWEYCEDYIVILVVRCHHCSHVFYFSGVSL